MGGRGTSAAGHLWDLVRCCGQGVAPGYSHKARPYRHIAVRVASGSSLWGFPYDDGLLMDPRDHIAEIEAIEQAACADLYAAAPASLVDKLGIEYCRIDDG